ncbi:glycosyltransferase family 4 protein [Acanthopleuribacter pedis]|uniref:Glycosyltransferase family 4 protein n=1 Tax=Acanthopleuribacter pedis TaxID=442870 RepID=A0A8J7QPM7_9BACT|nr:glycosyltransferase family 4 protein [Acanthopleuribacter pedis]MBO1322343.1 glycosyltransferase family 4 protein [Acanthopleuribacter pedis]
MKVAYLAAGAAGMYCGSCIRDNTLARELKKQGVDLVLVPTYTPMRTDEKSEAEARVFFGGINVYLQAKSSLFRRTPWALDRLLDRPGLLNWVSRFSSSTSAKDLGDLTVSMLEGEQGPLYKELQKLVVWLRDDFKPDLVHLTNSMLAGIGVGIRKALDVPVICSLQGEEIFLDALIEPYRARAMKALRAQVAQLDRLVATCDAYRDEMSAYLQVAPAQIAVARLGIGLDDFAPRSWDGFDASKSRTLGFFARQCPEKGLDQLLHAFQILAPQFPNLRLRVAGYLGEGDRAYVEELKKESADLAHRIEWLEELDRAEKIAFLQSLDVFSVPAPYRDPKGLTILEAMACGVPVVQPNHGAYVEIIEHTNGGRLFPPNKVDALAAVIASYLRDPKVMRRDGLAGAEAVVNHYSDRAMADQTHQIYRRILGARRD